MTKVIYAQDNPIKKNLLMGKQNNSHICCCCRHQGLWHFSTN